MAAHADASTRDSEALVPGVDGLSGDEEEVEPPPAPPSNELPSPPSPLPVHAGALDEAPCAAEAREALSDREGLEKPSAWGVF